MFYNHSKSIHGDYVAEVCSRGCLLSKEIHLHFSTPKLCSEVSSSSAVNSIFSFHCASQDSSDSILCGTLVGIWEGLGAKVKSSFEYFSVIIVFCTCNTFIIKISFVISKEVHSHRTSMRSILMLLVKEMRRKGFLPSRGNDALTVNNKI